MMRKWTEDDARIAAREGWELCTDSIILRISERGTDKDLGEVAILGVAGGANNLTDEAAEYWVRSNAELGSPFHQRAVDILEELAS